MQRPALGAAADTEHWAVEYSLLVARTEKRDVGSTAVPVGKIHYRDEHSVQMC